jgi:hypothetical protein
MKRSISSPETPKFDTAKFALGREFHDSTELADLMERERHLQYLDLGLERMIVNRATTVFTHSRAALATLRKRYPHAQVQPLEFPARRLPRSQRQADTLIPLVRAADPGPPDHPRASPRHPRRSWHLRA